MTDTSSNTLAPIKIPKPSYKSCDETSITITWHTFDTKGGSLYIQYREPNVGWEGAKMMAVPNDQHELVVCEFADLKPGTPYFVRIMLQRQQDGGNEDVQYGPESVIDTKPVDCTPKKKTCSIM
jgi:hypothetical protein